MMTNRLSPAELGRDLRHGHDPFLNRRRNIVGLALFSCVMLGVIALYQIGVLKKLPQPRSRRFDTDKVNGSGQAYSILSTPDALLGLASYAVTASLAGMGPQGRPQTHPWITIGMALKLLADAAMAGKLSFDELRKFKAFSIWSVLVAVSSWTALPLAIPEARAALDQMRGRNDA